MLFLPSGLSKTLNVGNIAGRYDYLLHKKLYQRYQKTNVIALATSFCELRARQLQI